MPYTGKRQKLPHHKRCSFDEISFIRKAQTSKYFSKNDVIFMIKNRDRKLPQCTKFDTDGSKTLSLGVRIKALHRPAEMTLSISGKGV